MMSNAKLENFKKLVSDEKSGWKEKALKRKANWAWREKSAEVAIRVLGEIRAQKKKNGMSQKKLAELMGVTPQYVNKIVKGNENLTFETISKLEFALGIRLMQVFSEAPQYIFTPSYGESSTRIEKFKTKEVVNKIIPMYPDKFTNQDGTNG